MEDSVVEKYLAEVVKEDNPDDYAYVPDSKSPSTWKLNISDAGHVGGALAALGPGYRGNKVEIPSSALAGVKAKVKAAWRRFHPDAKPEDLPTVLKGASSMTKEERVTAHEAFRKSYPGISKDMTQAEKDKARAAWMKAHPKDDEEEDLPDELQAKKSMTADEMAIQLGKLETQLAEATKRADRVEAVAKLSTDDRAVFEKLAPEKQDEFLKGDAEARKAFYPKEPDKDPVLAKRLEDLQKSLDNANARAEAAEGIAKVERDNRLKVEFQKKAEDSYPHLPGTAIEKGAVLQTIHTKLSKEELAEVEKLLASGDAALKQLGKGAGSDVPTGGDSWSKVETLAKGLVAADPKMTMAKAIQKVYEANPALYDEYLKENKSATQ